MTQFIIKGASAANNYSGASNKPDAHTIARQAAQAARGGGPLGNVINPELMNGADTMQRVQADMRADAIMQGVAVNQQRVGDIFGASDLSKIEWPTQDYYGWDHARDTSQLAVHIAQGRKHEGVTDRDIEVLKAAALFHDLGREEGWTHPAPGHRYKSAEIARELMKGDARAWFRTDLIDDVCRMIVEHTMPAVDGEGRFRDERGDVVSVVSLPTDPRLQCLWDAEAYEGMRFMPGTWEGSVRLKARLTHLTTPWARIPDHQRRWRERKGWV